MLAGAAATLAIGATFAASPAFAEGAFNVKAAPSGCTQTDFSGSSVASSDGAVGQSSHNNMICSKQILTQVTVTRGGKSSTSGSYTSGTVTTLLTGASSGTASGHHVLGNISRNT